MCRAGAAPAAAALAALGRAARPAAAQPADGSLRQVTDSGSNPGDTTRTAYGANPDAPGVALLPVSGTGHGLAVDPGSGDTRCGSTGAW